jgi:hypothetical protein
MKGINEWMEYYKLYPSVVKRVLELGANLNAIYLPADKHLLPL